MLDENNRGLKLQAESIVVSDSPNGTERFITLFKPEPETMEILRSLTVGQPVKGMILKDFIDPDGADIDVRIDDLDYLYFGVKPVDPRKYHTQVVSFMID
jgi:hypothetical protein